MQQAGVIPLPRGTFTVAPIEYRCNLSHRDGPVIHLGAIAEVTLLQVRGLGLLARTVLDEEELELIGPVAARVMVRPIETLMVEFKEAWANTEAGRALDFLSARTHGSLVFGAPEKREIPATVKIDLVREDSQLANTFSAVLKLLTDALQDKTLEMIWNTKPPSLSKYEQVDTEREKLVA
jgi:hypothetical protein